MIQTDKTTLSNRVKNPNYARNSICVEKTNNMNAAKTSILPNHADYAKSAKSFFSFATGFLLFVSVSAGFFSGCSKNSKKMSDGKYSGTGEGRNGFITLTIDVEDGKVSSVNIDSEAESDFAKEAITKLSSQIVQGFSVDELDSVSGATLTSRGTIEALEKATDAARGIVAKPKKYKNTSCDVVVIGSGGAGLSASVEAALKGADVIVLEKMGIVGGNSNYSTAGLNASQTAVQYKLGIEDSNEQYYEDTMKGGRYLNDPELVQTLVKNSADAIDWLIYLGADMSDVGKMGGSTNSRTHRPKGGAAVGSHLVSVLHKSAVDNGVDIRTRNKAVEILKNEEGEASGVLVETENGTYRIKADSVIVATGGFGANSEMVVSYRPDYAGFKTTNHKGATGDAIELLKPFNADFIQMEQIQTHPTVVVGSGIMITEAVRGNGAILVNHEGKRFTNEMLTRDVVSAAILAQQGKTAFLVFDQGIRESLKAIDEYERQGLLTKANSIEELAEKIGVPSSNLEKTISDYNKYQKYASDPEFGRKGSEMPRALEKFPYYAVEIEPAVHHTMGGVKINANAEVIDKSGNIVPGLFAAGEVAGGIHGANRLGGNAVADIVVFGRIAGDSAIKYAGIEK